MYQIKAHEVAVSKIVKLEPLQGRNDQLTSPDVGLLLVLEDSTKQKWLCEKDGASPAAGDFFVTDKELGVTYIVPVAKFKKLFRKASKG